VEKGATMKGITGNREEGEETLKKRGAGN